MFAPVRRGPARGRTGQVRVFAGVRAARRPYASVRAVHDVGPYAGARVWAGAVAPRGDFNAA